MTTATLTLARLSTRTRAKATEKQRHFPVENTVIWAAAFAAYIAVASYVVFHLGYMQGDAYSRVDNAFYVIGSRDPHLGAIGLVWPPLPSFLALPVVAFHGFWPPLLTDGFAGSIVAAACSAGTVVLINSGLRWAGVVRGMRWVLCAVWLANPMTMLYATSLESEPVMIFFAAGTLLVFVRWVESRRTSLLPLLGIMAGLTCLCRVEAFVLAFFVGIAVVLLSIRRGGSWREVETRTLLYALAALFTVGLWIGSMAVLEHDPLYLIHSGYANAGYAALVGTDVPASTRHWGGAVSFTIERSVALFPAVVALVALVCARILVKRGRLAGLLLLALGTPIMCVDVYLLYKGQLFNGLRYQIYVIPYTFVLAIYVLHSLKGRRAILSSGAALMLTGVLGLSNVFTGMTLGDPVVAKWEYPAVEALAAGRPVQDVDPTHSYLIRYKDAPVAAKIARLVKRGGLVLCDTAQCNVVVTTAPDPGRYVVTSDITFEAAAAQPQVYGVEYFLVPQPILTSAANRLNEIYPSLWSSGGGFSTLVADLGGWSNWRLYRITGPTGRG